MNRRASSAVVAIIIIAALALVPMAASAQPGDLNCDDFTSRGAAQAVLDADPTDPNRLDANRDGQACERFDYGIQTVALTDDDIAAIVDGVLAGLTDAPEPTPTPASASPTRTAEPAPAGEMTPATPVPEEATPVPVDLGITEEGWYLPAILELAEELNGP